MKNKFVIAAEENIKKQLAVYEEQISDCFASNRKIGAVLPVFASMLPEDIVITPELRLNLAEQSLALFPAVKEISNLFCYILREDLAAYLPEKMKKSEVLKELKRLGYETVVCPAVVLTDPLQRRLSLQWEVQSEPLWDRVITNLRLCSFADCGKKTVLYLLHADFQENAANNIGGVQLHVKNLVDGLKDEYNILVLARDGENLALTVYAGGKKMNLYFALGKQEQSNVFFDRRQRHIYEAVLAQWAVDAVHIHHTYTLSHDLIYAAAELGIPVYLSIHDYYYYCPRIKTLNTEGKICTDGEDCTECLAQMGLKGRADYIGHWRMRTQELFRRCEKIFFPSDNTKEFFRDKFLLPENKAVMLEHGTQTFAERKRKEFAGELRIAFIGEMSREKGSRTVDYMIRNSSRDLKWFVFGGITDPELLRLEQDNCVKTGWYKLGELNGLLREHKINLICILSVWPETFCYTLSEALAEGIPVIATDVGALGERVRKMDCGWTVSLERAGEEALWLIEGIRRNTEEYQKKADNTAGLNLKSTAEMVAEYREFYAAALPRARGIMPEEKNLLLHNACNRISGADESSILLQEILNSSSWRITAPLRALKRRLVDLKRKYTDK